MKLSDKRCQRFVYHWPIQSKAITEERVLCVTWTLACLEWLVETACLSAQKCSGTAYFPKTARFQGSEDTGEKKNVYACVYWCVCVCVCVCWFANKVYSTCMFGDEQLWSLHGVLVKWVPFNCKLSATKERFLQHFSFFVWKESLACVCPLCIVHTLAKKKRERLWGHDPSK